MAKEIEKKIEEQIPEEKLEELKKEVQECKEELKTKKGFWNFVKKWAKILVLPLLAIGALVLLILKGVLGKGNGDGDDLMDDVPADDSAGE